PDLSGATWRKSSRSGGNGGACVELANLGAVRDSKNPTGPALRIDLPDLVATAKNGRLDPVTGSPTAPAVPAGGGCLLSRDRLRSESPTTRQAPFRTDGTSVRDPGPPVPQALTQVSGDSSLSREWDGRTGQRDGSE